MRKLVAFAALSIAALPLAGCNTVTQGHILDNLQGCTRHYDGAVNGSLTGAGFTGTIKVDCDPKGGPAVPPAQ